MNIWQIIIFKNHLIFEFNLNNVKYNFLVYYTAPYSFT